MKKTRMILGALLIFGLAGIAGGTLRGDEPKGNEDLSVAVHATKAWLELIDSGGYDKSWKAAAPYFKSAVSKAKWARALKAVRAPLGTVLTREIKSINYATELPGAPDGKYVVVQFDTAFAHKLHATETATTMLDHDGVWKPVGYYIK